MKTLSKLFAVAIAGISIAGCATAPVACDPEAPACRMDARPTITAITTYREGDVVRFVFEGMTYVVSEVRDRPDGRMIVSFDPIF